MSRKPSDNRSSERKFSHSHFRSNGSTTTNNEENPLEIRLLSLIGNELRRTTSPNDLATLEYRITRILRHEFVNDIMMEINTSNDEIAGFFNRFVRSVPELNELCERGSSDKLRKENQVQAKKGKEVKNEVKYKGKREENGIFSRRLDENNLRIVLEMFRAPILVTCRACEDMRRIIRSGRRLIREIQLIAALRNDLNTLRRTELKCVEELDHAGNTRYRRHASSIENWRQLFRRRCRNIQPSSNRERDCYFIVFDRPDKPRIVRRISAKTKYSKVVKLGKRDSGIACAKLSSGKRCTNSWNEYSAKAEITGVMQIIRSICLISNTSSRSTSEASNTEMTSLSDHTENNSQYINESNQENSRQTSVTDSLNRPGDAEGSLNPTVVPNNADSTSIESAMECDDQVQPQIVSSMQRSSEQKPEDRSSSQVSPARERGPRRRLPSAGDAPLPFSVMVRTGSVAPQDVTVVLYSDRVLVASVVQRSLAVAGGWSGWLQRRWVVPQHVDVDSLRCFLGCNTLVVTVLPVLDFQWVYGSEVVALGPPSQESCPYPYPYPRRP